jgi:chorismate mutase
MFRLFQDRSNVVYQLDISVKRLESRLLSLGDEIKKVKEQLNIILDDPESPLRRKILTDALFRLSLERGECARQVAMAKYDLNATQAKLKQDQLLFMQDLRKTNKGSQTGPTEFPSLVQMLIDASKDGQASLPNAKKPKLK